MFALWVVLTFVALVFAVRPIMQPLTAAAASAVERSP
jgi:hypothetical protein